MTKDARSLVDVDVACDDDDLPSRRRTTRIVLTALDAAGVDEPVEVSVRIVGADEMRALNHRFRGSDKPTNVLSFPAEAIAGLPGDAPRPLGDIAICADVVRHEATAQDKRANQHWAHMLVHGTLHLLGYDHESDDEAREMEALEVKALAALGIGDPYRAT